MTESYRGVINALLRECSMCGAAVSDQAVHSDWHARLRAAVADDAPVSDLADQDR